MAESKKPGRIASLKAEFAKIVWPGRQLATRQTIAVILVSAIIGVLIVFFDMIIQYGLDHLFEI